MVTGLRLDVFLNLDRFFIPLQGLARKCQPSFLVCSINRMQACFKPYIQLFYIYLSNWLNLDIFKFGYSLFLYSYAIITISTQRWSSWLMASASKAEEPQGSGGSNPSRCVFFFSDRIYPAFRQNHAYHNRRCQYSRQASKHS